MRRKTYDTKCYELALQFLSDHFEPVPAMLADELAQEIQGVIEDYLEGIGHEIDEAGVCEVKR